MRKIDRDHRLDSLRGLFLVIMTINHFDSGSIIGKYTYQTFGFVTAAEGFIFLSGFVFALVYMKYYQNYDNLVARARKRVITLLKYHYTMLLVVLFLAIVFPVLKIYWNNYLTPFYSDIGQYFLASLLMLHQPGYMEILPMYAVFLFVSPIAIKAFCKGQVVSVMIISLSLWAVGQVINPVDIIGNYIFTDPNPGYFNLIAWQLVWFIGLWLGYRRYKGESSSFLYNKYFYLPVIFLFLILFMVRYKVCFSELDISNITNVPDFAWLRLVNFLVMTAVIALLLKPVPIRFKFPWVSYLGKYSLQVFSYHVLLLYLLEPLRVWIIGNGDRSIKIIFGLLVVFSLTIPAWYYERFTSIKNLRQPV